MHGLVSNGQSNTHLEKALRGEAGRGDDQKNFLNLEQAENRREGGGGKSEKIICKKRIYSDSKKY